MPPSLTPPHLPRAVRLGKPPRNRSGLQLVWPTAEEVQNSTEGWFAGGSIPGAAGGPRGSHAAPGKRSRCGCRRPVLRLCPPRTPPHPPPPTLPRCPLCCRQGAKRTEGVPHAAVLPVRAASRAAAAAAVARCWPAGCLQSCVRAGAACTAFHAGRHRPAPCRRLPTAAVCLRCCRSWGGEVAGRQRAAPHIKTYCRYREGGDVRCSCGLRAACWAGCMAGWLAGQVAGAPCAAGGPTPRRRSPCCLAQVAWLYVGSHNLSKAAWGALQKNNTQLEARWCRPRAACGWLLHSPAAAVHDAPCAACASASPPPCVAAPCTCLPGAPL